MPVLSARHKKPIFASLSVLFIFLIFISSLHPSAPHHDFISPYLHRPSSSSELELDQPLPMSHPSDSTPLISPILDSLPTQPTTSNPFSAVHVIHLSTHTDRLASVNALSSSLSLPFLLNPPATPKTSSLITHISNITSYRSSLIASLLASASPQDLYESPPFRPSSSQPEIIELLFPSLSSRASSSPSSTTSPTSDSWEETASSGRNVTFEMLKAVPVRLLREMTELKPLPWTMTAGQLACWDSHTKTIKAWVEETEGELAGSDKKQVVERKPLLILEDDVNAEQQVGDVFEDLAKHLPTDWDLVYLGFCASTSETTYPSLGRSLLGPWSIHPSSAPLCTHAYALSPAGTAKLSNLLRQELFAYSMSYDEALVFLIQSKLIKGYTISPPLVVQLSDLGSDIQTGGRQDEMEHTLLRPAAGSPKATLEDVDT